MTNTPSPSLWPVALKHGLIVALLGIVISLALFFLDMTTSQIGTWSSLLILIAGLWLGMTDHRDNDLDGFISYGRGVQVGMGIAIIAGIISAVYILVYTSIINPEYAEQILIASEDKMIEQGQSDETIEQALEMTKKFLAPTWMITFSVISQIILGLIFSLIVAAFVKKEEEGV